MKIPLESVFNLAIEGHRLAGEIAQVVGENTTQEISSEDENRLRVQLGYATPAHTRSLYVYKVYELERQFGEAASSMSNRDKLSVDFVSELSATLMTVNFGFDLMVTPNLPEHSTLPAEWKRLVRETHRMTAWALLNAEAVSSDWQLVGPERRRRGEPASEDQCAIGMLMLLEQTLGEIQTIVECSPAARNENRKEVDATLKLFQQKSGEDERAAQRLRSRMLMFGSFRAALAICIGETLHSVQQISDALTFGRRHDRFGRELPPRNSSSRTGRPHALTPMVHLLAALLLDFPEAKSNEQLQLFVLLARTSLREVTA